MEERGGLATVRGGNFYGGELTAQLHQLSQSTLSFPGS